jgi:hypothetical protein
MPSASMPKYHYTCVSIAHNTTVLKTSSFIRRLNVMRTSPYLTGVDLYSICHDGVYLSTVK